MVIIINISRLHAANHSWSFYYLTMVISEVKKDFQVYSVFFINCSDSVNYVVMWERGNPGPNRSKMLDIVCVDYSFIKEHCVPITYF